MMLQKALAGIRRINLEGLRWRVFDAKGQVGMPSILIVETNKKNEISITVKSLLEINKE